MLYELVAAEGKSKMKQEFGVPSGLSSLVLTDLSLVSSRSFNISKMRLLALEEYRKSKYGLASGLAGSVLLRIQVVKPNAISSRMNHLPFKS